jgi:hypothetical protein
VLGFFQVQPVTELSYRLVEEVVWRSLDGTLHAVYSPLSGETLLLNNSAIWVLEVLAEPGWHDPQDVVRQIANEAETSEREVQDTLGDVWTTLLGGGLLRRQRAAA